MSKLWMAWALAGLLFCGCRSVDKGSDSETTDLSAQTLSVEEHEDKIEIYRSGLEEPFITQVARADHRPYLHPIIAPDGQGMLTEYSPGHHKHQTGIYWGFTRVNGRDYFHNPGGDYWRKVSSKVLESSGSSVSWQTTYEMLDEGAEVVMTETQTWTVQLQDATYLLDLSWQGEAQTDVTIAEYDYGGLFIRMPWKEGMAGEAVNAARQRNEHAEGQRAMWLDVGMQVEGREDLGHITIMDHRENAGFPQTWRVDGQLGVGPARSRAGDWTIDNGETETIRHRLLMYTGALDDVWMTDRWNDYIGDHGMYTTTSLWAIAQQEGRAAKFLDPQAAVDAMTVKDGFEVNAWAAEPDITQPMAFCWDDKGRMWVAENLDYESRSTGFSNDGNSRILILEDTDRDGYADSRKVFLEGIPFPAAIAVGFGGLYLGAPPNLLFVPDRDQDDRADVDDIEVLLTGWGIRDRHETINSLHWGPDGWLYGCEGFATPSKIRKPEGKGRIYRPGEAFPADLLEADGVDIDGGIWRYHPTKDRFEVVAHGFSNPWGIDYDAKGQLFISACVIPHAWHIILGGIYHRQGGSHFSPYVYADIQTITDHRHRSAHGGARIYLSDAFPDSYHGQFFMANIHEHAVLTDVLSRNGSGFIASHGEDFLLANNAQWIGFSMEIGPEGGVYVLDWHDADICGKEVLHKETGRIFRIVPEQSGVEDWPGRYGDVAALSDLELVRLQTSKSAWHARRARIVLQGRASDREIAPEALAAAQAMYADDADADIRLRAFWTLHVMGALTEEMMTTALEDADEYIRAWSIQFLGEDKAVPQAVVPTLVQMAARDDSPVVRLYLASLLQRMDDQPRMDLAAALLARGEDADDHNIPKMLWYGIEPLVPEHTAWALSMAESAQIPLVSEFIARRLVDADLIADLVNSLDRRTPISVLKGMVDGMEGRSDLVIPSGWAEVRADLQRNQELAPLVLEVSQRFGDAAAAEKYLAFLQDQGSGTEDKRTAIRSLAAKQREELKPLLPGLLQEVELRKDVISAMAAYEEEEFGQLLLDGYANMNAAEQQEVLLTLSSRHRYGWMLTEAIKNESVPRADVPAYVARQLRRVVGNGFVEIWGPIDELSGNLEVNYNKYRSLLTASAIAAADHKNGRVVFDRVCGACHKMYGEGGEIGPDITGSNRQNLDYLLYNMLDPSDDIQDAYKMVVVTTNDGRTYAGNVANEDDRQLTLRIVGQEPVVLAKSSIRNRESTEVSMMPQGLLQTLSDEDVLDLVRYLQSTEQVVL